MKKQTYILSISLLVLIWASWSTYYWIYWWNTQDKITETIETIEITEDIHWQNEDIDKSSNDTNKSTSDVITITPTPINKWNTRTLLGKVIDNQVATVYPRREGIIIDIYVDIGDTVKKNQVIGTLLPPGVEWESNATIITKQLALEEAQNALLLAEQKAQNVIKTAEINQEILWQQWTLSPVNRAKLEEMSEKIQNKKEELETLIITQAEIIENLTADQQQIIDQVGVLIEKFVVTFEHAATEDHNRYRLDPLSSIYMKEEYGAKDIVTRSKLIDTYNTMLWWYRQLTHSAGSWWDIALHLLSLANDVAALHTTLLQVSIESPTFTRDMIQSSTTQTLAIQTQMQKAQEKIEDIANTIQKTQTIHNQERIKQENTIEDMTQEVKTFIANLNASQQQSDQGVSLTKSEQELILQQYRNNVTIAQAQLDEAKTKAWNIKITSPFAWIVSTRSVSIGDIVNKNTPIIELVNVANSLSRKAKKEITFGLPENLSDTIALWDTITYTHVNDSFSRYTWVISRISPQLDEQTNAYTIKAKIDWSPLAHNANVNVIIQNTSQPLYRVPKEYITYTESGTQLFVLDETENIVTRNIIILAEDGEFVDFQGDINETTLITKKPFISQE